MAISTHEVSRHGKDEWLTSPLLLGALGQFDLDPCAPINRPWDTAWNHYTKEDDGLSKPWIGRVWMNPPYGKETYKWMARLKEHGNGIALIFARTDTKTWFDHIWGHASAIMFLKGRLSFYDIKGLPLRSVAPSALVAYGVNNGFALAKSNLEGYII